MFWRIYQRNRRKAFNTFFFGQTLKKDLKKKKNIFYPNIIKTCTDFPRKNESKKSLTVFNVQFNAVKREKTEANTSAWLKPKEK